MPEPHNKGSVKQRQIIACLTEDEATALIELGCALEPFITQGSAADTATTKLDEQCGQQTRTKDHLIECVCESLTLDLDEFLPAHVTEKDMRTAAEHAVDQVLGYYGDTDAR